MNLNVGEAAPGTRRLFIVHSWPMIQSSLSLLHQLGESKGHDFFIATNPDLKSQARADQETALVVGAFGHSLVTRDEALMRTYDVVHLAPSFVLLVEINSFLGSLTFTELVAHGDNFKNTVFVSPKTAEVVDKIVKFGFNLQEEALKATKISRDAQRNPIVVSYQSIQNTWGAYADALNWKRKALAVNEFDLLVCERYWGASVYQMNSESEPLYYLTKVLDLRGANYRRIVFRPTAARHPGASDWESATKNFANVNGLDFTTWEELVAGLDVPEILNHPEAQFFLGGLEKLGGLFAFDGTLSLVFGCLSETTRVHWADTEGASEILEEIRISDYVAEQLRWMRFASARSLVPSHNTPLEPTQVSTDGVGHLVLNFEAVIEGLEAQIASKDALEAQVASKDALLAAKDASFSWRVTKPLRVLGELFFR
jgi:hypothetical protein